MTFDKKQINVVGKAPASFVCPGHPLLDATTDLVIEQHRDLLKRGTVLIDETDPGDKPRVLLYLEHSIQDARTDRAGARRVVSKRLQFVEITPDGKSRTAGPAPYLDYRPPTDAEIPSIQPLLALEWLRSDLDAKAQEHAALHLVPQHFQEVREHKESLIDKTLAAVKERLTKEINYWDHRAEDLKAQELAGRVNAKLNSGKARERVDDLLARLQKRTAELEQERRLSPLPPVVLGGALIIPTRMSSKDVMLAIVPIENDNVVAEWSPAVRDRS